MELDKHKAVSFSGYRPHKFEFPLSGNDRYEKLVEVNLNAIMKAIQIGYHSFIVGGAPGYDILCAEMIRLARHTTQQKVSMIFALPYADFKNSNHFDDYWRSRYDSIIKDCDHIINVTGKDHETRGCYQRRNKYMIDNSTLLICYHTGKKGGTANTIQYAESKGTIIKNIADSME